MFLLNIEKGQDALYTVSKLGKQRGMLFFSVVLPSKLLAVLR